MKKKDRIFWAVYIVAGMVMMAVGLNIIPRCFLP